MGTFCPCCERENLPEMLRETRLEACGDMLGNWLRDWDVQGSELGLLVVKGNAYVAPLQMCSCASQQHY